MFEEQLVANINWLAVIVGAVVAYAVGSLWYSPKMFGTKWMAGVGISKDTKGPVVQAMIAQGVATFLLAWIIGITETTDSIYLAILIALTIALFIKANGLWSNKSNYAIKVEAGYVLIMAAIMILAHIII